MHVSRRAHKPLLHIIGWFKVFFMFSPIIDDKIEGNTNESVEGDKQDVRQEPYSLPSGFEWDTLDLADESTVSCISNNLLLLLFWQTQWMNFDFAIS